MNNQLSFIPLGGIGDVTRNMYLYQYGNEILIVDCGLGFADETMLGVDLLLPDISELLRKQSNIVGMVLTHGHEDHIGALPFILPQLSNISFPIYATPLTSALANEKLAEFGVAKKVNTVFFDNGKVNIGSFEVNFIRVTHSVPDASNLFIKTPAGNFFHASDFKFDLTPKDQKRTEFEKIIEASKEGVLCLMSDSLGAEHEGYTESEIGLTDNFEKEIEKCKGKFLLTTYSSNISRLNQGVEVAKKTGRKVCFVGRSLMKAKEVAQSLGYMILEKGLEVSVNEIKSYKDNELFLFVAGSQAQESSALSRIANDEHKDIRLGKDDVVVFSADPIPGNELAINSLIDAIAKKGSRVIYSEISKEFHVSGHGSSLDLMLMMSLVKPKKLLPISGTFRQMVAYKQLAKKIGYGEEDVLLIDDGQEVLFSRENTILGKKIDIRSVYVDQITEEVVESFVLRDRKKLSEGGIVTIVVEIDSANGQVIAKPDIIARGFTLHESSRLSSILIQEIKKEFSKKRGRVSNWVHLRKHIENISEQIVFKKLRKRPLILPVIIEI